MAWRFHRFLYGIAAVVALFHDVLITVGLLSIFNIEITLAVVAALLAIVGYSLNDTIVVSIASARTCTQRAKRVSPPSSTLALTGA